VAVAFAPPRSSHVCFATRKGVQRARRVCRMSLTTNQFLSAHGVCVRSRGECANRSRVAAAALRCSCAVSMPAGASSSIDGGIHEAIDSIQRGDSIYPDDTIHLGGGPVPAPAAKGMEETFAERKQADDSLMVQRVLNLRYKSDPARHYAYQRLHPLLNPDRSLSHLHVTWESAFRRQAPPSVRSFIGRRRRRCPRTLKVFRNSTSTLDATHSMVSDSTDGSPTGLFYEDGRPTASMPSVARGRTVG